MVTYDQKTRETLIKETLIKETLIKSLFDLISVSLMLAVACNILYNATSERWCFSWLIQM